MGSERQIIFTLVHGTLFFARGAAWTKSDSALCTSLSYGLSGPSKFLTFEWTGRNTNAARIEGGRALAEHIRKVSADHPNVRHVVIAHSQGGNVALYALRDIPKPHPELITLATPFIHARIRMLDGFFSFVENILLYFIGLTLLLLIVVLSEFLVQGTIGA